MKKDIKNEIISAARELFSINGYNAVTMRDVADALGISVGNLTYHFKKKEDLIEAVIIDQHRGYRKHGEIKTLAALDGFLRYITEHHDKHQYYFRHYAQLSQPVSYTHLDVYKRQGQKPSRRFHSFRGRF